LSRKNTIPKIRYKNIIILIAAEHKSFSLSQATFRRFLQKVRASGLFAFPQFCKEGNIMDWDDPASRYALIEQIGPEAYNKALEDHIKETTVAVVGGHAIRPVGSRFGRLFQVGNTEYAFQTLPQAEKHASDNPVEFNVSGIVDVNLYQSLLAPDFTLRQDGKDSEKEWDNFHVQKYTALVLEQAVLELKKILERLPAERRCVYVEGSAHIYANYAQNILDRLYFKVKTETGIGMNEARIQEYLRDFFLDDWNAEFGAAYRISEYISSNYHVGDFPSDG
jgi:uncharacterized protein YeaO (DUF488 family)